MFFIRFFTVLITIVCHITTSYSNDNTYQKKLDRYQEAIAYIENVLLIFYDKFIECTTSPMPNQQFLSDNIQSLINNPAKTTVGFAPKFTSNRKFFANMLSTTAFKEMLENDAEVLRQEFVKKLKYCDKVIMDPDLLKSFYDREVDQSKI